MPHPEYEVHWAHSPAAGKRFPVAMLVGDTDFATLGYATLSSDRGPEVVITKCSPAEQSDPEALENRVNAALSRTDLRYVRLIRAEDRNRELAGSTFQQFREQYRKPTLYFADILTGSGEAEGISVVSAQQFLSEGGIARNLV